MTGSSVMINVFIFFLLMVCFSGQLHPQNQGGESDARLTRLENSMNRLMENQDRLFNKQIPVGTILAWYNRSDNVPEGWAICNGSNGTPDLRDRFLMGTASQGSVGSQGGENKVAVRTSGGHAITSAQMPRHSHGVGLNGTDSTTCTHGVQRFANFFNDSFGIGGKKQTDNTGESQAHNHSIPGHDNRPAYCMVVFIMKVRNIERVQ